MHVKRIGIVLETREDAINTGIQDLNQLYHWREPEEIAAIIDAIRSLGLEPLLLGPPAAVWNQREQLHDKVDFIFNLSVGFQTRFRLALGPALYEISGLPYSGADPYTKLVSQNKHLMKSFWEKSGIPTPDWVYLHTPEDLKQREIPDFPLIVKPAYEGSSIGIPAEAVVNSQTALKNRVEQLYSELQMPIIMEQFITGREFKIGVIGNEEIKFIGMIEDLYQGQSLGDQYLYFQAKTAGSFEKAQRNIHDPQFAGILKDCRAIYSLFTPLDYGTFDIRVDPAGRHYFLEFNADATLHPRRTLAQCSALNGLGFKEMIGLILQASFKRWRIAWS